MNYKHSVRQSLNIYVCLLEELDSSSPAIQVLRIAKQKGDERLKVMRELIIRGIMN